MKKLNTENVTKYVEENIGVFHQKRIDNLNKLKLKTVLKKKNPYLFKAKNLLTAEQIIKSLTDAFISSNEETIFGDWLEGLAIYINSNVYDGKKSSSPGIDLEFDNKGIRYLVSIKSGPNWGNSSQVKKMIDNFNSVTRILRTSNSQINVISINGCCYGRDNKPLKKANYYKYCGQVFWEFLSGEKELYTEIIEPLGHKAKEKNDEFVKSYSQMINVFTKEFINEFCNDNGEIDWEKLVKFNSGKDKNYLIKQQK